MKGSPNDAISARVPCGIRRFAFGKTMLDPPPVSSHHAAPVTNG